MNLQTRQHTETTFLEVSRAAARKKLYALKAEQEGNSQLARLFRAIAVSEEAQARRLLLQLRGQIEKTDKNSQNAFAVEIPELVAQYQRAADDAENEEERAMQSVFSQLARVQKMHLSLKKKLDKHPEKRCSFHVCSFCGFTITDHTPEYCPICTAAARRFIEI